MFKTRFIQKVTEWRTNNEINMYGMSFCEHSHYDVVKDDWHSLWIQLCVNLSKHESASESVYVCFLCVRFCFFWLEFRILNLKYSCVTVKVKIVPKLRPHKYWKVYKRITIIEKIQLQVKIKIQDDENKIKKNW